MLSRLVKDFRDLEEVLADVRELAAIGYLERPRVAMDIVLARSNLIGFSLSKSHPG